jgi:hypothetical protein
MPNSLFLENHVATILLYTATFWSNVLTLVMAVKKYQSLNEKHITYESGVLSDPILKRNLNSPKAIVKRYAIIFALTIFMLFLLKPDSPDQEWMYQIFFGILFFFSLNQLLKAVKLYITFQNSNEGTRGRIEYTSWFILHSSGTDQTIYSFMYLLLFIITQQSIFLGGTLVCVTLAARDFVAAKKLRDKK